MLVLLLAGVAGLIVGVLTGLLPGIHINAIAAIMVGVTLTLPDDLKVAAAVFILAAGTAHLFFDYLPTFFLGVPGSEAAALLPSHQLVRAGRGGEALHIAVRSSLMGLSLAVGASLLLLQGGWTARVDALLRPHLFWVLLGCATVLIVTERHRGKALLVFLLAGLFGVVALGTPLVPGGSGAVFGVLMPALTGLFGLPNLLRALRTEGGARPPQQPDTRVTLRPGEHLGLDLGGVALGAASGLLPGLGGANMATLGLLAQGRRETQAPHRYIALVSSLQAADTVFGITAWYLIEKARSGVSVSLGSLVERGQADVRTALLVTLLLSAVASSWLVARSWRGIVRALDRLDQRAANLAVIAFLCALVAWTTGAAGLTILGIATVVGMTPGAAKVRQAQLMGFFLVPVLLYFSGHQAEVVTVLHLEAKLSPAPVFTPVSLLPLLPVCGLAGLVAYVLGRFWTRRSQV